jgi:SdpI/YfhL protein family
LDFKLTLLTYIIPGLASVLAIPMVLGLVPPNRYYGFRTPKTLGSADVWYKANRICGYCLALAGIAAICHNLVFLHDHPDWSPNSQQFVLAVSSGVLLLLGIAVSAYYVRKL